MYCLAVVYKVLYHFYVRRCPQSTKLLPLFADVLYGRPLFIYEAVPI